MKTIDLIKKIYKMKREINPFSTNTYNTYQILFKIKNEKLLRRKFERSLRGNKSANKFVYSFSKEIYFQHIQKLYDKQIYEIIYNSGYHYIYKTNKNNQLTRLRCFIYNNIFFFTYDKNLCKILQNKFIIENKADFTVTWRLNLQISFLYDLMFFAMHIHEYLNKNKKKIRVITINYYVKTENSYYPREFRISQSIYNTKSNSIFISTFVNQFYKTWRFLHLDDYYDASEEQYFLIKIRFKDVISKRQNWKPLKLPRFIIKESFAIKRKSYNKENINHDFNIVI